MSKRTIIKERFPTNKYDLVFLEPLKIVSIIEWLNTYENNRGDALKSIDFLRVESMPFDVLILPSYKIMTEKKGKRMRGRKKDYSYTDRAIFELYDIEGKKITLSESLFGASLILVGECAEEKREEVENEDGKMIRHIYFKIYCYTKKILLELKDKIKNMKQDS